MRSWCARPGWCRSDALRRVVDSPVPAERIPQRLRGRLYEITVFLQEASMRTPVYRQLYRPKPNRAPDWLRRIWQWL